MPTGIISDPRQCKHCQAPFIAINVSQRYCSRICAILGRITPAENGCLLWTGGAISDGYGCIKINGRMYLVHRVLWEHQNGPIPTGKLLLHHCDVRRCINMDHLYVGDHADNTNDMVNRLRFHRSLTDQQVKEIRNINNLSQTAIAKQFGVTQSTIHRIKARKSWTAVG